MALRAVMARLVHTSCAEDLKVQKDLSERYLPWLWVDRRVAAIFHIGGIDHV